MFRPGQVRFILACLVILFHLSQSIFLGKFAVGCFFILSGYWISLMYDVKYLKMISPLKVFYISRLWRLLPVFYTFTLLGLLVNFYANTHALLVLKNFDLNQTLNFFLSNIFILGYSESKYQILVPAWSLDIELQFYLIFPPLFYIMKGKKERLILITILAFLIALYVFLSENIFLTNTILYYLYLFLFGCIVYSFELSVTPKLEKVSIVLLLIIIISQYAIPSLSVHYRDTNSKYFTILSFVLIMAAIPLLIRSVHTKTDSKDRFWGEMSFIVYLSHWVWLTIYNKLIINVTKFGRVPYVIGFLLITFITAYLVYKLIDRNFERLRHNWISKQKKIVNT